MFSAMEESKLQKDG